MKGKFFSISNVKSLDTLVSKKLFLSSIAILLILLFTACSEKKTTEPPQTASVTVNLTTDDGGSVVGAEVVLQNHSGGSHQQIASSESVLLTNIPYGTYSVIISLDGYYAYNHESLSVQTHTVTHSATLINCIIQFGGFNWRVLAKVGERALIISENILEQRAYNTVNTSITYEQCTLREYLNNDFYNSFNIADRERIYEVTNTNANNQWYGANGGNSTKDKIFLLSLAEVVQYFGDSGQLANRPNDRTWWINDQFNSNRIATFNGTASWWLLRSLGSNSYNASYVSSDGDIRMYGVDIYSPYGGVRPALWLDLSESR